MIIFLAGDIYGQLGKFYDKVAQVEEALDKKADYILQTGNLGAYPDPASISSSMRNHHGAGDFARWYVAEKPAPRPTVFISGKHEDHRWMDGRLSRGRTELLPQLYWLVNGSSLTIGYGNEECVLAGIGKVFSPKTYSEGRGKDKKRLSHYTRAEVERACCIGPVDILLLHEPPKEFRWPTGVSNAEGLSSVIFATRPKIVIHGKCGFSGNIEYNGRHYISLSEQEILPLSWENGKYEFLKV